MARVIFDQVTKRYAGAVEAVKDLNMEIEDNEFLVLVGPSGCGKINRDADGGRSRRDHRWPDHHRRPGRQ